MQAQGVRRKKEIFLFLASRLRQVTSTPVFIALASAHAFESRVNTPLASSKTPGKECLLYIGTTINDSKYISRNIELTLLILPEMILHV